MARSLCIRWPGPVTSLKWLFCLLTALLVAVVAFAMATLIAMAYWLRVRLVKQLVDNADFVSPFLLYGGFNVACGIIGGVCVIYGAPQASGSGLPELVGMLNGVDIPNFLTFRTFFMKVIGAVATVAASLPLGYQGVMLHIGGMLAYLLASLLPRFELTVGAKRSGNQKSVEELTHCMATAEAARQGVVPEYQFEPGVPTSNRIKALPRISARGLGSRLKGLFKGLDAANVEQVHFIASTTLADQVACGAAAGAAAAFKAPVGAMLYLMELSTRWRIELTWRAFFSTSVTVLALTLLSRACSRSSYCSSLEAFLSVSGGNPDYSFTTPYAQLPLMIVFAAIVGALGSLYIAVNCAIVKLRGRWSSSRALLLAEVVAFVSIFSIAMLSLTRIGKCKPCDSSAPDQCDPGVTKNALASVLCDEGEYNDLAVLVVSPTGDNIRSLWSMQYDDFTLHSLLAYTAVYFVAAAWTSGLAIPSGAFSPTILLGSCFGRIYAHILRNLGVMDAPDASLYALLGAAAFFTGQTRMTVSLCVIMLELVRVESTLPFLMVVVIVAKGVADRLGHSIILRRIQLKRLPFIHRMPHLLLRKDKDKFSAANIIGPDDHPVLSRCATVGEIRKGLFEHPSASFFVIVNAVAATDEARANDPDDRGLLSGRMSYADSETGLLSETNFPKSDQPFSELRFPSKPVFIGIVSRSLLQQRLRSLEFTLSENRACLPRSWIKARAPELQTDFSMDFEHGVPDPGTPCSSTVASTTALEHSAFNDEVARPLLPSRSRGSVRRSRSQPSHLGAEKTSGEISSGGVPGRSGVSPGPPLGGGSGSRVEAPTGSGLTGAGQVVKSVSTDSLASSTSMTPFDIRVDLGGVAQAPPISISPSVSLQAIFVLMNNMALEILPVIGPGGAYNGVITRATMMRFQGKRNAQDVAQAIHD